MYIDFDTIDTIIIIIIAFLFIYGFLKGFISLTIPIISILASLIIAPIIYNHLSKSFNHSLILKILSLLSTYVIIRLILSKVGNELKSILKLIFLNWIDKLLGSFTLVFIFCFIIYIVVSAIILYFPDHIDIIEKSKIIVYVYNIFHKGYYI